MKPADGTMSQQVCRVCGGEVNPHGECVVCGTKQDSAPPMGDRGLSAWLKGESSETSAWLGATTSGRDSRDEALSKWLAGEDTAFQDWLGVPTSSGVGRPTRGTPDRLSDDKVRELREKALETDGMRAELESMRSTLNRELANFRQGKFDPVKYIEETANLSKQLQTEIAKRRELEQEIEHIKKGSIAVIKYVKTQQLKAGASPEMKKRLDQETKARQALEADFGEQRSVNEQLRKQLETGLGKLKPDQRELKKRELDLAEREAAFKSKEDRLASIPTGEGGAPSEELKRRLEEELREMAEDYLAKEEEFKKRIIGLEEEVGKLKIEDKVRAEARSFEGKPKSEVQAAFSRKEQEVLHKEKMVLLREQELQRLQADLQAKEDEIKKVKEPLTYKEEELLRREEDLTYHEKVLQAEHRKMEEAKAQGGSVQELDLKSRLEELKGQINTKEEEVRTKERYLQQKMEELRLREQGLIAEDIEAREQDLQVEVKQQKVKMGIGRLDDLLFGGIPFGTNASVYGPAYVGKEVLVSLFMAEGLKKGVPVLWILTDKGPAEVREEMAFALPGYEEYEKLGLVQYIDTYSKSMGMSAEASDAHTTYIDDPTDHQAILKSVLCIKGICDVQSRGWIRYTYTKSSLSIGSFSLDHIK